MVGLPRLNCELTQHVYDTLEPQGFCLQCTAMLCVHAMQSIARHILMHTFVLDQGYTATGQKVTQLTLLSVKELSQCNI